MKYFLSLIAGLFLIAATMPGAATTYEATSQSRIWVDGTSTIHDWTCEVGGVTADIEAEDGFESLSKAVITVSSEALECKNGTMNKKALSALNAKKHKNIRFTLTGSDITKNDSKVDIQTTGRLELAGQTKTVTANVAGEVQSNGAVRFTGSMPLTMSDFGIDPPTAMLGTMRTGDDVTIRFDIVVEPTK